MMGWWIGLFAASPAVETGGDTGVPVGDTAVEEVDTSDTAAPTAPARSAAALAGEEGGCRCTSSMGPVPGSAAWIVLVAIARRRP